jgi:hypothetical protein
MVEVTGSVQFWKLLLNLVGLEIREVFKFLDKWRILKYFYY